MRSSDIPEHSGNYNYSIFDVSIEVMNEVFVQNHSAEHFNAADRNFLKLQPESIAVNTALFSNAQPNAQDVLTRVIREGNTFPVFRTFSIEFLKTAVTTI